MRTRIRTLVLISCAAIAGSTLVAGPAIAVPDYSLSDSGLQQTVLRAQMPTALGAWRQNIYFALTDDAPSVCWSATGTPVTLPKAAKMGGVAYEVNTNVGGSVAIYQYKDLAAAAAALAALKNVDCPDSAKVSTDDPDTAVKADQGSDYTDASMTGFVSSVTYKEQGTPVTTITRTTQRGLAVVQTDVTVAGQANTQNKRGRASALSARWHRQVLVAYEAFGSGSSR
jgi:hypothetical protein